MRFRSFNPYDGQIINEYEGHTITQVDQKIQNAHEAFLQWKNSTYATRSELIHRAARELSRC